MYVDPAVHDRVVTGASGPTPSKEQEVEWKRKDGTRMLVRLSGRAVRGPDGGVESFEMMAEDITERRVLEEAEDQAAHVATLVGTTRIGARGIQAGDGPPVAIQDAHLRVGVDAGCGGIQGPLFEDGSFEFICIPKKLPTCSS